MIVENTHLKPKVLCIIVTWNKKEYVMNLLNSLSSIDYPRECLDIIVVDNASSDGTGEALKSAYPYIHLIENSENLGGTGGFNTGLAWAFEKPDNAYEYLWLLDNDVLVHQKTLNELVKLLEEKKDAAIAGSTMMQLDCPWRVNEIGAYVSKGDGSLVLNHHAKEIKAWQGMPINDLLSEDPDLSKHIMHVHSYMDVDYVAAASLLIRYKVAKQAGLWLDFFIHYDDVEWCMRVAAMGYRVLVSSRSLIWHMSAAAKVPTWVVYYDCRNMMTVMRNHYGMDHAILGAGKKVLKSALYYGLMGKPELMDLALDGLNDSVINKLGSRKFNIDIKYRSSDAIESIFDDTSIKRVLIPWTVNLDAVKIREALVKARIKRPDIHFDFMTFPGGRVEHQFPRSDFIMVPKLFPFRYYSYYKLRKRYDLVFQSDYQPVIALSWINAAIVFINDEGFFKRSAPKGTEFITAVKKVWNRNSWIRSILKKRKCYSKECVSKE